MLFCACPPLFAGQRIAQQIQLRRAADERANENPQTYGGGGSAEVAGGLFFVLFIALIVGLWIFPMIKAFKCPSAVWGVLILFFGPVAGIIFLIVGCCEPQVAQCMVDMVPQ